MLNTTFFSIDLSSMYLKGIPEWVSGLSALTELDLQDNQLTDISALSGLSALTTLWLQNNQLTDVSALSGLSALTELDLQNNQLTEADIECLQPLIDRGCKVMY